MLAGRRHRRPTLCDHWRVRFRVHASALVSIAALLGMVTLSLTVHGDEPEAWDFALTLALALVAWFFGYLLAGAAPWLPGAVVLASIGAMFAASLPDSLSGSATAPPLGYANANGALLAVAASGAVAMSMRRSSRAAVWAAAIAATLGGVCALTGSRAASLVCMALAVGALVMRRGVRLWWQAASVILVGTGVALTGIVGATYSPGESSGLVSRTVSSVRAALWSDALEIASRAPALGIGPGDFAAASAVARSDSDLAHAHSLPLQVLAELGGTGFLLLIVLFLALIWRLGRASMVLALLCLQPLVDYTLDFVAVVVAATIVLGGLAASCPANHASSTSRAQIP